jgi:hypothetical protein
MTRTFDAMRLPRTLLVAMVAAAITAPACGGDDADRAAAPSTPTTAASSTSTTAAEASTTSTTTEVDPARFGGPIDNPYLPLVPGTTMTYESDTEDGL